MHGASLGGDRSVSFASGKRGGRSLVREGGFEDGRFNVRLFAIGAQADEDTPVPPLAVQITWDDILRFIHGRMISFRDAKRDHDQWDQVGKSLYAQAIGSARKPDAFVRYWNGKIGPA